MIIQEIRIAQGWENRVWQGHPNFLFRVKGQVVVKKRDAQIAPTFFKVTYYFCINIVFSEWVTFHQVIVQVVVLNKYGINQDRPIRVDFQQPVAIISKVSTILVDFKQLNIGHNVSVAQLHHITQVNIVPTCTVMCNGIVGLPISHHRHQ